TPPKQAPVSVEAERAKVEPPAPPERQPADLVSLDDAANEPATTADSSDDSTPFGLGL
ncbi:MAG: hypothetical protein IIB60_06670, partial [Planctomycetes bacterium]|nr:hypothetical protein [Planctomycetota bacterium]